MTDIISWTIMIPTIISNFMATNIRYHINTPKLMESTLHKMGKFFNAITPIISV